jgi:circadian clock protein KaiB
LIEMSGPSAPAEPDCALRTLELRLYVAGDAPNSLAARANLRALLSAHPELAVRFEVIDVLAEPEQGERDNVLVTPTLIRRAPLPERRVIGNLQNHWAVRAALGIE